MRYAYLTCELLGRDLDSRLLIAANLIKRGVACIVGQQWSMFANAANTPGGVFLFKTANAVQGVNAALCRKHGHRVIMSDEEVLAMSRPDMIASITARASVEAADRFLVMDQRHRDVVDRIMPGKATIAGSVRVDLLMNHASIYRVEADQAREAGPYILFNTSFATLNSVWGSAETALGVSGLTMASAVGVEKFNTIAGDTLDFERAAFGAIKELLAWTRASFPQRIVLRPHPAEKTDPWRSLPGVEVVEKTNPIPWLMGADLMIHANSTTGLEGALIGTPCLNMVAAEARALSESFAINDVNYTAGTVEEAKSAIENFLKFKSGPIAAQSRPAFVSNGAETSAEQIASLTIDGPEIKSWKRYEPQERQVEKFSISAEDFLARMKRVFDEAKVTSVQVAQLDRALFLVVPA